MIIDESRRELSRQNMKVVGALRAAGITVESVYDLVNQSTPAGAVPVLLQQLGEVTEARVREGIVRALGVKAARPVAAKALLQEFRDQRIGWTHGWAVANSLAVVCTKDHTDEVVELIRDAKYGRAREPLLGCVHRLKPEAAAEALVGALDDPELAPHAIAPAMRLKLREALPALRALQNHEQAWVRKAAAKAVKKLESSSDRTHGS